MILCVVVVTVARSHFKLQYVVSVIRRPVKAKFHYASWFEAGSKLVADRFESKLHYAIWFEACRRLANSNQLRTSFEPDSVMEFGRKPAARASSLLTS